eukprot:1446306-Prymnesium_polylepis.1
MYARGRSVCVCVCDAWAEDFDADEWRGCRSDCCVACVLRACSRSACGLRRVGVGWGALTVRGGARAAPLRERA